MLPEPLTSALGALWLVQTKWTDEIQVVNAQLRELVQRRYPGFLASSRDCTLHLPAGRYLALSQPLPVASGYSSANQLINSNQALANMQILIDLSFERPKMSSSGFVWRRFRNIDPARLESEILGNEDRVACKEDPEYKGKLSANRKKAREALQNVTEGQDMGEASMLLLQVGSCIIDML